MAESYEEVMSALRNADAAGDTEAAAKLAGVADRLATQREVTTTPGGAVTGITRPPSRLMSEGTEAGAEILGAGAISTALSVAAPQILGAAATATQGAPAPFGPMSGGLRYLSEAARHTPVASRAVSGAVGGLMGETVGQMVDQTTTNPVLREGSRFVAGGLTPEAATFVNHVWSKKLPTTLDASMLKQLAKKVQLYLTGKTQDIDAEEAAALNKLRDELRGGPKSDAPAEKVYDILDTGARTRLALGETEAQTIIGNANRRIQEDQVATLKGVLPIEQAQERIASQGRNALNVAQLQLHNVGQDAAPSDIGGSLRGVITTRNEALINARNAQFKEVERLRDEAVAARVARGEHINKTPEYDALVASIKEEMKTAAPATRSGLENLLYQITNREKDVFGQEKPLAFNVFDQTRRKLGQVFKGEAPEGYAGIDADIARRYYAKISDLQKRYAGPHQETLIEDYALAKEGLEAFRSKAGKKFTAVDRYDDSKFETDAASLPASMFKTKQGVADLIELTGSRPVAAKAARDWATSQLSALGQKTEGGITERQVRNWMTDNREMLEALPEVRAVITKFANQMGYGERVHRAAKSTVENLKTDRTTILDAGGARSQAATAEAQKGAAGARQQRAQEATVLAGDAAPAQRIKQIIEGGSAEEWSLLGPHINSSPDGKRLLAEAVRQSLADRADASSKGLSAFFNDKLAGHLKLNKLMNPTQIDNIAAQLHAIENLKIPERERLNLGKRVLLQAFAGYASSVAARGVVQSVPRDYVPGEPRRVGAPDYMDPMPRSGLEQLQR